MKVFLQIDGDRVTGLLEAIHAPEKVPDGRRFLESPSGSDETLLGATVVTSGKPGEETYTFERATPAPDYGRAVDARDFMLLFTQAERLAIRQAATTDPAVADWADVARMAGRIRLRHPLTVAGLQLLVAKNLLTAARRDAIAGS